MRVDIAMAMQVFLTKPFAFLEKGQVCVCVCMCVCVRSAIPQWRSQRAYSSSNTYTGGHKDLVYNFYDRYLVFQGGIWLLDVVWFGWLIVWLAIGILISSRTGDYYWLVYSP